jgi:hypothetical protein
MKKGLLALLSLSMLLALPACYKDKDENSTKEKGGKKEMKNKKEGKKDKKEKGGKKEGKKEDKHHKTSETKKVHEKHQRSNSKGGMEETETTTKKTYSSRY